MYQTTGLHRSNLDKYYTKPNVASECLRTLTKHIRINKTNDVIIEPSAGSGVFIPFIEKLSLNVYYFDIEPEHDKIIKQDFLKLDMNKILRKHKGQIHVIGNPPFGRQSSLAKKFITKATEFADTIAFILPKSFKKTSMKKVFPLNWHLKYQKQLNDKSFTVNKEDLSVPSIFQIWYKDNSKKRIIPKSLMPVGFKFVKQNESPDFVIRRIGFYAGTVSKDTSKNPESHLFIKVDRDKSRVKNKSIVYETFKNLSFTHKNTVGPRSVSKQEILQKLPNTLKSVQI